MPVFLLLTAFYLHLIYTILMKKTNPIKIVQEDSDENSEDIDSSSQMGMGMRASRKSSSQRFSSHPNFGDSDSFDELNEYQQGMQDEMHVDSSFSNVGSSYMREKRGRGRPRNRGRGIQRGIVDQIMDRQASSGRGRRGRGRGRGKNTNPKRNAERIINMIREKEGDQSIKKSSIFMQSDESQNQKRGSEQSQGVNESIRRQKEKNDFDNVSENEDSSLEEKKKEKRQILDDMEMAQRIKERNDIHFDSNDEDESDIEIQIQKITENSEKNNYKIKQYLKPKMQEGISQIPILQGQKQVELEPQIKETEQEAAELNEKRKKIRAYAEKFGELKTRRVMKYINGKFDLTVRTLHELVYDCYLQGLINQELMLSIMHMGIGNYLEFTIKYKEEKLSEFDFQKVKFTLFDHRRLTKLLMQKGKKQQYTIQKPVLFSPYQIHVFLEEVYALPEDVYQAFCYTLDQAYNLTWWKNIGNQINRECEQKIQEEKNNIPKRNTSKRIKYKIKVNEDQKQQQNKIVIENQVDEMAVKIQQDPVNKYKNIFQESQQEHQPNKKKKSDKESVFSSSLLDSQALMMESSFSISSKTNSLQSDLFSDLEDQKRQKLKKKKVTPNTKQRMEQKQMQKVKKSSLHLKKVEDEIKNVGRKKQGKQSNKVKTEKKVKKIEKQKGKKQQKEKNEQFSEESEIDDNKEQKKDDSDYNSDDI